MKPRRVVITGTGAVCALGRGCAGLWQSLSSGQSGFSTLPRFAPGELKFSIAGIAKDFPDDRVPPRVQDLTDRFAQFLLASAQEAVAQAGLAPDDPRWEDAAVITGTSIGGETVQDESFWSMYGEGKSRVHPLLIPRSMPNSGASHLSMAHGVRGQVYTVSTACSSANHAIGQAFMAIRSGVCDLALTGGSEAPITFGFLKAWEAMRVVSPDTCRPFSHGRGGLILGEGGGILVLESEETALARGADILAELAGFGMSADAHHLTIPKADGAALAMRRALDSAGLAPEEVQYINAHGTGTPINDPVETAAIRLVFGDHANALAVSSTKSMHGHVLGGAGAIEAIATVLAIKHRTAPPTANFTEADPECDLDYVPNSARPMEIHAALSNSFAFGGLNAVLAFRRYR
ncbi:MAG: beta-ketoacyl-[acyl-carrier-protein] synthase family protein [Bryobacterales bacterium]|nr:beta-ketoacyl-[acyl-carrier-protein] synthase family protein [Bryobacterales bacterium]